MCTLYDFFVLKKTLFYTNFAYVYFVVKEHKTHNQMYLLNLLRMNNFCCKFMIDISLIIRESPSIQTMLTQQKEITSLPEQKQRVKGKSVKKSLVLMFFMSFFRYFIIPASIK